MPERGLVHNKPREKQTTQQASVGTNYRTTTVSRTGAVPENEWYSELDHLVSLNKITKNNI